MFAWVLVVVVGAFFNVICWCLLASWWRLCLFGRLLLLCLILFGWLLRYDLDFWLVLGCCLGGWVVCFSLPLVLYCCLIVSACCWLGLVCMHRCYPSVYVWFVLICARFLSWWVGLFVL